VITPSLDRLLLPLLLVCGLSTDVRAEPAGAWATRVWQSDEGLPNNNVTGLAQTTDGYLWVSTLSRPARFDGVAFESFHPKKFAHGLNQKITALLQTSAGLWMGMDHGPLVLLNGKTVETFTEGFPDKVVLALIEDSDGAIWVTYRGGSIGRLKNGQVTLFTEASGLPRGYVCSLAKDTDGRLHFAKHGQLGVIREDRFEVIGNCGTAVTRIAPARSGGFWVVCGQRLFRFKQGRFTELGVAFHAAHPESEATVLLEDHRGGVWIGTNDSGLFHFDDTGFAEIPISHRTVSSLLEDQEGNLWVGTEGGGLTRVRPRAVTLENAATGLPFETIQSLTEDLHGTIWATTQNGLVVRSRAGVWETMSVKPHWPGGRATCIAADKLGGVWIGTKDRALHYWREGKFTTWQPKDGLIGRTIHALVVGRSGELWIGEETPDIVQRLHEGKFETFRPPGGIRVIRAMAEDTTGAIWVGTSKGTLLRIANGKLTDETANISTSDGLRSIRYLYATDDGRLWIAYADEGLGMVHQGRFFQITSEQGLPDDNLSQIVADGEGWLWISGNRGIFKARQTDLEAVAEKRIGRLRTIGYGPSEGLRSLQANFGDSPNATLARNGRIWMPMRTAIAVVNPENITENVKPPPVLLTRIAVNEQTIAAAGSVMPIGDVVDLNDPNARLEIPPDHRRLELDFTALSFSAPENVSFRYRLDGFDDDWVDGGGQRRVIYPRLPQGRYRFHVKACNGDGIWNENAQTIAFTVRPFFWQTWWFRISAFAVLISSIAGGVRYASFRRLRRRLHVLEQQAALARERARIARDIHDDLGSRLTQTTLLVELAQRAPQETSGEHLPQIAATVRQVSESLDEIIWAVNPRNDVFRHLVNYVSQFAVDFLNTADIRCRADLPDELPGHTISPEVRHHLLSVVKEALTNIVRHSGANEVWLRVEVNAREFTLVIEDNGRGCAGKTDDPGADGLRNMHSRMKEIGGIFHLQRSAGGGTQLTLTLPWSHADATNERATNALRLSAVEY
jgi:ligand-binding sensor domain-containing protein/signal transduction histidine kinase